MGAYLKMMLSLSGMYDREKTHDQTSQVAFTNLEYQYPGKGITIGRRKKLQVI